MDELDLLKKDWKKRENSFNQVSENDIYKMLHKRSSSIVKWILIISICEFIFWIGLSLLMKQNDQLTNIYKTDRYNMITISEIVNYIILLCFIFIFYKNYIKINANQSVKELIKNILKTKKTVQVYIKVILFYSAILVIVASVFQFNYNPELLKMYHEIEESGYKNLFIVISLLFVLIYIGLLSLFLWGFYKLIYGILLKKLYKNYEELKKLEL
ncbi:MULTISPECIES: hypothetical protein [Flavobacterium]|uniref:Beta-carotene 15,15'-monooxygenase n=1 Tax=Flavobacterium jumunjinense TaxID=998845 RepID=A0ABV5GU70_9FLAO|nr:MULTISPECIES: hypothetical protein [Flavobacterium]